MNGQDVQLVITLNREGGLNVNGPLDNTMLCYGLLECARDAIREHHEKSKPKLDLSFLRGAKLPPPPGGNGKG